MILRQRQDALRHFPAESAEVAGVRAELYGGKPVDEAVKSLFEEGQHLSIAPLVLVGSYNVIFRLGVQNLHHLPYQLRPLLQVCIDQADICPLGMAQAGIQSGFLAEVPEKLTTLTGHAWLRYSASN